MAMRNAAISQVVRALSTVNASVLSDRELLERYAFEHDQAAFAAMVHRHRSMVEGVCRRTLANPHDVEDACQAVFLLLARKSGTVRWQASASNWLYTTARRVAHNARVASERRARRERRAALPEAVSPVDTLSGRELLRILDEELERLSPRYREALVLCCLEGLARDEAASRLGVPDATLASRLARGRKRLADALSARGFSLGAALLAATATCTAEGCSPKLVDAILNAVSGSPSAPVAALVREVAMNGVLTHTKFALLATVGVVALGFGFAANQLISGPPQQPELKRAIDRSEKPSDAAKAPADARPAEAGKDTENGAVEVSGRVLGPDGKPVMGATLHIPQLKKNPPKTMEDIEIIRAATSDAEGRFGFTYNNLREADWAELRPVLGYVIAYKDGFGVDWAQAPSGKRTVELTLRLVKDQSIAGRIIDTQGKPVAGAAVNIRSVGVPPDDNLDKYLAGWKNNWSDTDHELSRGLPFSLDAISGKATTDKDGKFKLNGAGAERIAYLGVQGSGTAGSQWHVLTRPGVDLKPFNEAALAQEPGDSRIDGRIPVLYGPESTIVVESGNIVEGVVKDQVTGKPLAGVRIRSNGFGNGFTDALGKYRLEGLPRTKTYRVHAEPPEGCSYIRRSAQAEATSGAVPVHIDVALVKGVVVSGRVVDRQTGKGVEARIVIAPLPDNEFLKKPIFECYKTDRSIMAGTDLGGRFRVVTIPGKSVLMVQIADANISPYLLARPDSDHKELFKYDKEEDAWFFKAAGREEFLDLENIVKVLDLKDDNSETKVELFGERGGTAKLIVQDADGKPLTGAFVAGLTAHWPITFELKNDAATTVLALDPERPRRVLVVHPDKNLGGTVTLRGDEKTPVVIKLAPLGAVTGRLLEIDGTPLAGANVSVDWADKIASDMHRTVDRTAPPVKTDKEGRFTLRGILPGIKFDLGIQKGEITYAGKPKIVLSEVKPGQTLDLGERRLKPAD